VIGSVIILAGGAGTRWGNHTGKQKHLLEVDGERLIDRTVRLARKYAEHTNIHVVSEGLFVGGTQAVRPRTVLGTDHDKLAAYSHYWDSASRTVILWGDIWLSEAGAEKIFTDESDDILWFGRLGPSYITGKRYGEFWAVGFTAEASSDFAAAVRVAARRFKRGEIPRDNSWSVYFTLHPECKLLDGTYGRAKTWREVDDQTEDFDFPHDWDRWIKRHESGKWGPCTAEEMTAR
jgi:hypothetical protein